MSTPHIKKEHEVVIRFRDVKNANYVSKRINQEVGLNSFVRTNETRELLSTIAADMLEVRRILNKFGFD